jgi:hypothetical protein
VSSIDAHTRRLSCKMCGACKRAPGALDRCPDELFCIGTFMYNTIQGVGCVNSVCGAHVLCIDAAWRLSVYVFDMGLSQTIGPCDTRLKKEGVISADGHQPDDGMRMV